MHGCGLNLLNYKDERIQSVVSMCYAHGRRGYFVDIGANQGAMALNVLALGCDIPYLGFEPDLIAAHYTQELIRVNQLRDHFILPIALGCQNAMATLHSAGGPADVSSTLGFDLRPRQMYRDAARVAVSTADDQLATLEKPVFLVKIDAEGWELNVLRGMERILRESRPPVYFEVMGYRHFIEDTYPREYFGGELSKDELNRLISNRRDNMAQLEEFWRGHGYTLSLCHQDGTLQPVDSIDPGPESEYNCGEMNFLAVNDRTV